MKGERGGNVRLFCFDCADKRSSDQLTQREDTTFASHEDGLLVCPDNLFFQGRPSSLHELVAPLKRLATQPTFMCFCVFFFVLFSLFLFLFYFSFFPSHPFLVIPLPQSPLIPHLTVTDNRLSPLHPSPLFSSFTAGLCRVFLFPPLAFLVCHEHVVLSRPRRMGELSTPRLSCTPLVTFQNSYLPIADTSVLFSPGFLFCFVLQGPTSLLRPDLTHCFEST